MTSESDDIYNLENEFSPKINHINCTNLELNINSDAIDYRCYDINNDELIIPEDIKWINHSDIDYPNYIDIICYYFKSLFNNNINKYQYLIFKSKTYTLINRGAILLSLVQDIQNNNEECLSYQTLNSIDKDIITIYQLCDQYLKENCKLFGLSHAPFKDFINNYFLKRNILLKLDNKYKDYYTNDRFLIVKRTSYIVNQMEILFEFVKVSVDNNDQLPFKLLVLTMNFFIILGEYLWKYYWFDGSKSYGNN